MSDIAILEILDDIKCFHRLNGLFFQEESSVHLLGIVDEDTFKSMQLAKESDNQLYKIAPHFAARDSKETCIKASSRGDVVTIINATKGKVGLILSYLEAWELQPGCLQEFLSEKSWMCQPG